MELGYRRFPRLFLTRKMALWENLSSRKLLGNWGRLLAQDTGNPFFLYVWQEMFEMIKEPIIGSLR